MKKLNDKKKILIIVNTGLIYYGGLTTVAMNYYRNMDLRDFSIDFASTNQPDEGTLGEITKNRGKYFKLPRRGIWVIPYFCQLRKLCKAYDVIHVHGNSATMAIELYAAKSAGIKKRIAHCHTSQTEHPLLNKLLISFFKKLYTDGIACSKYAGDWIFGEENYTILPNAIDLQKYALNVTKRKMIRKQLGIDDMFILGHVGKLNEGKNHKFLLQVYNEYLKLNDRTCLLLVGDGPLRKNLSDLVEKENLSSKVFFIGMVDNVADYLCAMDAFVFPSLYEGLPLSVVEAQAAGKKCFISDTITREVGITSMVHFLSIRDEADKWARYIYNACIEGRENDDIDMELLKQSDFNIENVAEKLERLYKGKSW